MCRFIVIERTKNTFLFVEEVNRVLFGEVQLNDEEQFCCSDRSFVCLFVYGTLSIEVFINYFNFVIVYFCGASIVFRWRTRAGQHCKVYSYRMRSITGSCILRLSPASHDPCGIDYVFSAR